MTEFIAGDKNLNYYTYTEIDEELATRIRKRDMELYCIGCGKEVGFKRESKPYDTIYSSNITRRPHFFHREKNECEVIKYECNEYDKSMSFGIGKDEISKRYICLSFLINKVHKSYKEFYDTKNIINKKIREAQKYDINFIDFMSEYIKNLYYKKNLKIGFKDIENMVVDRNVIYEIGDYIAIYKNLKLTICEDLDRFSKFIKNLTLISSYYSLCNQKNIFQIETENYITILNKEIKEKKLSIFVKED